MVVAGQGSKTPGSATRNTLLSFRRGATSFGDEAMGGARLAFELLRRLRRWRIERGDPGLAFGVLAPGAAARVNARP